MTVSVFFSSVSVLRFSFTWRTCIQQRDKNEQDRSKLTSGERLTDRWCRHRLSCSGLAAAVAGSRWCRAISANSARQDWSRQLNCTLVVVVVRRLTCTPAAAAAGLQRGCGCWVLMADVDSRYCDDVLLPCRLVPSVTTIASCGNWTPTQRPTTDYDASRQPQQHLHQQLVFVIIIISIISSSIINNIIIVNQQINQNAFSAVCRECVNILWNKHRADMNLTVHCFSCILFTKLFAFSNLYTVCLLQFYSLNWRCLKYLSLRLRLIPLFCDK